MPNKARESDGKQGLITLVYVLKSQFSVTSSRAMLMRQLLQKMLMLHLVQKTLMLRPVQKMLMLHLVQKLLILHIVQKMWMQRLLRPYPFRRR